jgi:hypothetical protein
VEKSIIDGKVMAMVKAGEVVEPGVLEVVIAVTGLV